MKQITLCTILFIFTFTLFSQTRNPLDSMTASEDIGSWDIKNKPVVPDSFYIKDLGDFYSFDINRNRILTIVDEFLGSITKGEDIKHLNRNFSFIFMKVYRDKLNEGELTHWFTGVPVVNGGRSSAKVELHYREKLLTGVVYLERVDTWEITDLQIEEREKGFFDPSSPN